MIIMGMKALIVSIMESVFIALAKIHVLQN